MLIFEIALELQVNRHKLRYAFTQGPDLTMMFVSFSEPDLSADGNYEVRYKCNVLIYSGGEVLWVPPAIYQVRNLDYTNSLNRNNRTE